jgi:hypothetical protein
VTGWERRIYDDTVVLTGTPALPTVKADNRCSEDGPAEPKGIWHDGCPTGNLSNPHVLGAATRLANGTVIVAGGLSGFPPLLATTTAEIYDPALKSWSVTGSLSTPRWSLDAITLDNGKALFAGGSSAISPTAALATAEIYDPGSGTFSPTDNDLSVARHSPGISRLNDGRILISGGNTAGTNLNGTGVAGGRNL